MRRKWIIPLVVCFLLLIAMLFRWEQGPTQTDKNLITIYKTDRWTGQSWIKYYGTNAGRLYSGDMKPVITPEEIEKRKIKILSQQEEFPKKQELEKILADAEQTMKQHAWGQAKYVEYGKALYNIEHPPLEKNYSNYYDNLSITAIEENLKSLREESRRTNKELTLGSTLYEEYEYGIPQTFIEDQQKWLTAMQAKEEANAKLSAQVKQAEIKADSELETWAWQERNIATYIWIGLLVIMASLTLLLFKAKHKPE